MLDSKEIGKRIKQSREAADMSLNDVGKKLNLNKSTILRYENGEMAKVKAPIIEQLAAVLRVSPHYLMGWSDNPQTENCCTIDDTPISNNEMDLIRIFRQLDLLGQNAVVNEALSELKKITKE